jgi:hypothetical protein
MMNPAPPLFKPFQQADHRETLRLQPEPRSSIPSPSKEISRLLSAAVVNRKFRHQLLTDPVGTLAIGYNGVTFMLDGEERKHVLSIRASSLESFASQLVEQVSLPGQTATRALPAAPYQDSPVPSRPLVNDADAAGNRKHPTVLVSEAAACVGKALYEISLARYSAMMQEPEIENTLKQAETALHQAKEPLLHLLRELTLPDREYTAMGLGAAQSGD